MAQIASFGGCSIMRLSASIQTFVPVVFGLGFVVLGIMAFIHVGYSQQLIEDKLQCIRTGKIQPDPLTVVGKYVSHGGKVNYLYVVFSCSRQPKVNLPVTVDFFNSVKQGDTIDGYYFSDGYFIPQNQMENAGTGGKWFFLSLGVLLGAAVMALALAMARIRQTSVSKDALQTIIRDKLNGH